MKIVLAYLFGFAGGFCTMALVVELDPGFATKAEHAETQHTIAALEANARKYDAAVKHLESLLEESWATQDKLADALTKEVQQAYRDADKGAEQ